MFSSIWGALYLRYGGFMRGSLSRVALIKFQWLLSKGSIKNFYARLALSDAVGSTVAPVLGKSCCNIP